MQTECLPRSAQDPPPRADAEIGATSEPQQPRVPVITALLPSNCLRFMNCYHTVISNFDE